MKTGDHSFQPFINLSEQCSSTNMKSKIGDKCITFHSDFSNIRNIKKNCVKSDRKKSVMCKPKKSKSTNNIILPEERTKLSRKRHSWGMELEKLQRYNTGDFLRQQILEDLDSPEIIGKSEDQIAADRYQRLRAYLDQRSKPLIRSWTKCIKLNSSENEDSPDNLYSTNNKRIKRRFSDYYRFNHQKERSNYRTRKIRSDANIRSNSQMSQKPNYRRTRSEINQKFYPEDCRHKISQNNWANVEMLKLRSRAMKNRSISCPEKKLKHQQNFYNLSETLEFEPDELPIQNFEKEKSEREAIIYENDLQVEAKIPKFQLEKNVPIELFSLDTGYDSIPKGLAKAWMGFRANSNVKKSDTFRIVDGSEENVFGGEVEKRKKGEEFKLVHRTDDDMNDKKQESVVGNENSGDYFWRVYDLLKRQQEAGTRRNDKSCDPMRSEEETDPENFYEIDVRQRRRRKKRDQVVQGEELVVSSGVGGRETFCRPQLRDITPNKRRPPPPPVPSKYKINHRDISKYFDYPNKENRPGYVSSENQVDLTLEMGSNLSRHSGKGLTGRRTQSSGNLCDPKGKLNHVGKILVPCSSGPEERYKMSGSLPNSLDDKESLTNEPLDNNNVISDTISGNMGGTLPHKKRAHGVHFSDDLTETLDLVKHRSQESLEGDPWRYQQSSDLDLVRCKHGNYDLVRKNQSLDTVDSGIKYTRVFPDDKYHNHHLDLVGTLPKRRIDPKWCDPSSIQAFQQQSTVNSADGDLLMKVVHKPGCELMKHRQLERPGDIKTTRLAGEHQDQGYASERSPEEEHPPFLPGQSFPNVDPESTYRVILQKSSRGLGLSVSGGGTAGPVRVKRLFPQQPAALSNKLQPGDILLEANGVPLTGLTNYEALEVLRTTSNTVELLVCRLPGEEPCISPPGAPPPPPLRRELPPPPPVRLLNPLPLLQIEPCGEFDIEMTKVGGSLGFTLRKVDSSALGHYVRALVREPALSDGRIQPGDKIVAVDGAPLSPMSHEEAVALLRQCGPRVKLRLYRDLAQTPVSALSPTEPDHPLRPPRTSLRQEAVDMLCDLAVRKLTPGTSNGSGCQNTSGTSTSSPRRLRRPASRTPTGEREHEPIYTSQVSTASQADTSDSDQCSIKTQITNSQAATPDDIIDPPPLYDISDSNDRPLRPNFLNLSAPMDKPNFQFSLESESEKTIVMGKCNTIGNIETVYVDDNRRDMTGDMQDNDLPSEPASMPPMMSSVRTNSGAFSYKNPAYQSANPTCGGTDNSAKLKIGHSSDQDIPGKVLSVEDPAGSKGLLKWKGVMFAPDDEEENPSEITGNSKKTEPKHREGYEVFMVELTRGWNSRLGFSLQSNGDSTVISMVHPDSVAAKDGRLKQGDVLIMVNDESVEDVPTAEIIDLLRKIRGPIGITIARKKKDAT